MADFDLDFETEIERDLIRDLDQDPLMEMYRDKAVDLSYEMMLFLRIISGFFILLIFYNEVRNR